MSLLIVRVLRGSGDDRQVRIQLPRREHDEDIGLVVSRHRYETLGPFDASARLEGPPPRRQTGCSGRGIPDRHHTQNEKKNRKLLSGQRKGLNLPVSHGAKKEIPSSP